MDLLRIVVKKRSESETTEDKASLSRFASRVAKLRGEGPMATSLEPEVALEVVSINIKDIEIPPDYVRKHIGDVTPLVASIKTYGIQQPLKVVKIKGTKKFRLVFGSRRLKAAELAGLDAVPCIVELATKEDRLKMLSLAENMHRCTLSPMEEGESYKLMKEKGEVSINDIANNLGIDPKIIKDTLEVLKLPEAVRTEVINNPSKFSLEILKFLLSTFRKSKTNGKKLFKAILSGKVNSLPEAEKFISEL